MPLAQERKKSESAKVWMTLPDGKVRPGNHEVPLTKNYILKRVFNAWEKNESIIIRDLTGKELTDYFQFLSTLPQGSAESPNRDDRCQEKRSSHRH